MPEQGVAASSHHPGVSSAAPVPHSVAKPPWLECLASNALLAAGVLTWVVSLGGLSLSWDMLNHHVYLGWMAVEGSRLRTAAFAAGSMSCQFPLAYAPLYALLKYGATGTQAAAVLALPSLAALPAVWLVGWSLWPVRSWQAALLRLLACALAILTPLWWSLLDSTSNDALSSLPMLWAFALVLWTGAAQAERCSVADGAATGRRGPQGHAAMRQPRVVWWFALAGTLAATALAIKISQVFMALGVLVLAVGGAPSLRAAGARLAAMAAGGLLALALVWWPFARPIWQACGSPFYPLAVEWMRPYAGQLP